MTDRCTVILGSGVNLDFHKGLSTKGLTESIMKSEHDIPWYDDIGERKILSPREKNLVLDFLNACKRHLRNDDCSDINFEMLLQFVLDILNELNNRDREDILHRYIPELKGFDEKITVSLCEKTIYLIMNEIFLTIGDLPRGLPNQPWAECYFRHLEGKRTLDVFTLNYDDVFDFVFDAYNDGFQEYENGQYPGCRYFDDEEAMKFKNEEGVFNHLHGSIHFSRNSYEGDPKQELPMRKFFKLWEDIGPIAGLYSQNHSQTLYCPIITGLDKMNSLTHDPYRSYHSNLTRSLAMNDRAILIGYGFGDFYINALLHTFIRKEGRKMMCVSPSDIPYSFQSYGVGHRPSDRIYHVNTGFKKAFDELNLMEMTDKFLG